MANIWVDSKSHLIKMLKSDSAIDMAYLFISLFLEGFALNGQWWQRDKLRRTTGGRSAFPEENDCEPWEPAAGFISTCWYELLESKPTLIWCLYTQNMYTHFPCHSDHLAQDYAVHSIKRVPKLLKHIPRKIKAWWTEFVHKIAIPGPINKEAIHVLWPYKETVYKYTLLSSSLSDHML